MFGKRQPATISALILALLSTLLLSARPAQAATETVVYTFTGGSDGDVPTSTLTLRNGNLYGMTQGNFDNDGDVGPGTVFQLSPNGGGGWDESTLYTFCSLPNCADGEWPNNGYVLFDGLGNMYGTTAFGGAYGYGTVFELSPAGDNWTETVLYSFANNGDGAYPVDGLLLDSAGNLYGTIYPGAISGTAGGVFELSPSGGGWTEQLIFSDQGSWSGLTMDSSGNIYGASASTVFELSPNGGGGWTAATLFKFPNPIKNGSAPNSTLVFDQAGNLYGTTTLGGKSNAGTVYKLTPVTSGKKKGTWTEKLLGTFKGGTKDGANPYGPVVFDAAGNLYGATVFGGKDNDGVVYELVYTASTGKYKKKVLWSFTGTGGSNPGAQGWEGLIPDGAGNFYSVASYGGLSNYGVVFELTP